MNIGPIDVDWIVDNLDRIGELLLEHIFLTVLAVAIGFVISFALALLIRNRPAGTGRSSGPPARCTRSPRWRCSPC